MTTGKVFHIMTADILLNVLLLLSKEGARLDIISPSDITFKSYDTPTPCPLLSNPTYPTLPQPTNATAKEVATSFVCGICYKVYICGYYITTYYEYYNRYLAIPAIIKYSSPYFEH